MTSRLVAALSLALLLCAEPARAADASTRILDGFETLEPWSAHHTDDVSASIASVDGKVGKAMRLSFDFADAHGEPINGYATARRALPLDFAGNYELSFWVRGEAGINTLQFKLVDDSGANVWWINKPDFAFPHEWTQIRIRKRQLAFAWGPTSDKALRHSASIEFVVSSGRDGGRGVVDFDQLEMRTLPPADTSPLKPRHAVASSTLAGSAAAAAIDGNDATAWRSDARRGSAQHLDLDLGAPREFGGLVLHWRHAHAPARIAVSTSDDGKRWQPVAHSPRVRNGDDDALLLTESETRWLRLALDGNARGYALNEVQVETLDWGASPNAFFENLAKTAPRGSYPRGFVEQPYWTIVGVDGGPMPALISEDGAIQPGQAGFSLEPFLRVDGKLLGWADGATTPGLRDGYLPIPSVAWKHADLVLTTTAFADGDRAASQLFATYEVRNDGGSPQSVDLVLAVRPFQVNPPAQFLNTPGGVAPIHDIAWQDGEVAVDGVPRIVPYDAPTDFVLAPLSAGTLADRLAAARRAGERAARDDHEIDAERDDDGRDEDEDEDDEGPLRAPSVHDDGGGASAAMLYHFDLPAGARERATVVLPLSGAPQPAPSGDIAALVDGRLQAVSESWKLRLDRVRLRVPPAAQYLVDSLRSAHAHMLLSRDGPVLRPGTRSYARSWVRDGAMIGEALLRLGDRDAMRAYVDWYAPHQFANGKVPCCVDHRGPDPVPENDSHGELIHAIAELYRYGGRRDELERQWPHVAAAIAYMDGLRDSQTALVESGGGDPSFRGLLPASISHEGYSAKPMHSYWDDFWGLTGYKDAVEIANALGRHDEARRIAASRDAFARDLQASIVLSAKTHAIDYIPGSAELGDFDATSTTIALAPAGEQARLPADLLQGTFERYWRNFAARADGSAPWNDYTPYEWRTVGSFVRLGWRERALSAIGFFFASGARPPAWNQWAEVVRRDPRTIGFIGDMPHAWVASDFVRSVLDLFAYERRDDGALVLAAGIPTAWLDGDGIAVERLNTPYGELSYSLRRDERGLHLHVDAGAQPPGGLVVAAPGVGASSRASSGGRPLALRDGELRLDAVPADVVIRSGPAL